MFITAFNQAFQPNYYELMEKKDRSTDKPITQIFTIWLSLITFATCMGIIIGRPFLKVFAGSQFGTTSEVFPYLLYATYIGSFYYFFSSPIFYFKKTGLLPFITGSSAIINISLNLLLIPNHGIIGASIATIISHLWISVVSFTVGHRLYKMKWPYLYIFMSVFVVSIVFVMYI
jgi:O-antigen/teichoic acid export membrane protein